MSERHPTITLERWKTIEKILSKQITLPIYVSYDQTFYSYIPISN